MLCSAPGLNPKALQSSHHAISPRVQGDAEETGGPAFIPAEKVEKTKVINLRSPAEYRALGYPTPTAVFSFHISTAFSGLLRSSGHPGQVSATKDRLTLEAKMRAVLRGLLTGEHSRNALLLRRQGLQKQRATFILQ